MRVMLIGSGGREHALAWKLAQSPQLTALFCVPGNPGTARHGTNLAADITDHAALLEIAQREQIDLVVVGPDGPLADGVVDVFSAAGIACFGPTAAAARLEGSKAFAKSLMYDAGVPTAASYVFDDANAAAAFVHADRRPWVVKADGLALGKGVVVAEDVAETLAAIEQLSQLPGGRRLLLEERLVGREVSLLALSDGTHVLPLPPARDHKRLLNGDRGPNTGGMGVIAPLPELDAHQIAELTARCLQPIVTAMARRGTPFRGVLYAGLMLTADGPRVLEYNARFGDPETQALLPLLDGDLLELLAACAAGDLGTRTIQLRPQFAQTVILCAHGYPADVRRGDALHGLDEAARHALVFHAGTALRDGQLVTAGGRVLALTALGDSPAAARAAAYRAVDAVTFAGMHYRTDIGEE
jgi:phosphoribosylamine---glycine ligase